MKVCGRCGELKGMDGFYASNREPDGRQSWCKDCKRYYNEENADKISVRQRDYLIRTGRRSDQERPKREPLTEVASDKRAAPPLIQPTERYVLDLLHRRYDITYGNGFRYVTAEHVRSHAGFDAKRTADLIAMDLWPSKGFALHGHEVKVSRSDFLSEMKDPDKAMEFIPYMTYWWLVIGDASIVDKREVPATWGLLVVSQGRLRMARRARRNQEQKPLTETRMAALLRAVAKTARRTP